MDFVEELSCEFVSEVALEYRENCNETLPPFSPLSPDPTTFLPFVSLGDGAFPITWTTSIVAPISPCLASRSLDRAVLFVVSLLPTAEASPHRHRVWMDWVKERASCSLMCVKEGSEIKLISSKSPLLT
ncbi:hypothetical protein Droror1_Dr00019810 [Drosera rotundifolia]